MLGQAHLALAGVQAARQALRDHQGHRRGDVVRRHAHVHQPRDGLRGVVGVQGRQHHVAGLRGLDRDLGGFQVADFADHDHVRVLTQEAAQRGRERHPALDVHLHLVDAGHPDFHRILDRGDVALIVVEQVQAGVQRHRLARTGRAGHQHHAVGPGQRVLVQLALVVFVSELVDAHFRRAGIQDAQHHLLAEQRRQGAHAEVDLFGLGQVQLHAAVLRHALLGDVQLRHHLEAGGDARLQGGRHLGHLLEHAVDAQAHPVFGLVGFEVDVRRPTADRVHQYLVDELHHRGVVDLGIDAGVARQLLFVADLQVLQSFLVAHRLGQPVAGFQPLLDRALQLVGIDQDRFHHQVGLEIDLVDRRGVGRVGDAQEQPVAALEQRQHVVLAQQRLADQLDRRLRRVHGRHVQQRHPELDGIGRGQLQRADQPVLGQVLGDGLALGGGGRHRAARGMLVQRAIQHQPPGDAGDSHQMGSGDVAQCGPSVFPRTDCTAKPVHRERTGGTFSVISRSRDRRIGPAPMQARTMGERNEPHQPRSPKPPSVPVPHPSPTATGLRSRGGLHPAWRGSPRLQHEESQ